MACLTSESYSCQPPAGDCLGDYGLRPGRHQLAVDQAPANASARAELRPEGGRQASLEAGFTRDHYTARRASPLLLGCSEEVRSPSPIGAARSANWPTQAAGRTGRTRARRSSDWTTRAAGSTGRTRARRSSKWTTQAAGHRADLSQKKLRMADPGCREHRADLSQKKLQMDDPGCCRATGGPEPKEAPTERPGLQGAPTAELSQKKLQMDDPGCRAPGGGLTPYASFVCVVSSPMSVSFSVIGIGVLRKLPITKTRGLVELLKNWVNPLARSKFRSLEAAFRGSLYNKRIVQI